MRVGEDYLARQTGRVVAAAHAPRERLGERYHGTDRYLHIFGGALPDAELELAAYEIDDVLVEAVASDVRALGGDDTLERDDSDVGRAAADIEHHRTDRLRYRQFRADGARNRLFEDDCFARARVLCCVADRATLHIRHPRRHADDDPRAEEPDPAALCFINEIGQQLFGHLEVRYDAVGKRPHRADVRGRLAEHTLRLLPYCDDLVRLVVHRDDRGLVDDDALAAHVHECVRGSEIDRDVA